MSMPLVENLSLFRVRLLIWHYLRGVVRFNAETGWQYVSSERRRLATDRMLSKQKSS